MTARARVTGVVAAAALAAAGITVAATALTSTDDESAPGLRAGAPPLVLDLFVRTDGEARALRRALGLYERGRRPAAARIFERYESLDAAVGAAMAGWPGTRDRLEELARTSPPSRGVAQLNAGLARYWARDDEGAREAWRAVKNADPDSLYAVRAGDLLHPEFPVPGLPVFVPSFPSPAALGRLSPPRQLAFLERRARTERARDKILYGVALQRLSRPISARRAMDEAAALEPDDPEALTAAAVSRFDKDRPQAAFSRLGPLARRYPNAATVRFHLGLLLLWMGQVEQAKGQLRRAVAVQPGSTAAMQAREFLDRLR